MASKLYTDEKRELCVSVKKKTHPKILLTNGIHSVKKKTYLR